MKHVLSLLRLLPWITVALGVPASTRADDFDTPGIRTSVNRQLTPYGLDGWHDFRQRPDSATLPLVASERMEARLKTITLPSVKLEAVPLVEALSQLQRLIQEHDRTQQPSERSFVIIPRVLGALRTSPVTLHLNQVTARDALDEITRPLGLRFSLASPQSVFVFPP